MLNRLITRTAIAIVSLCAAFITAPSAYAYTFRTPVTSAGAPDMVVTEDINLLSADSITTTGIWKVSRTAGKVGPIMPDGTTNNAQAYIYGSVGDLTMYTTNSLNGTITMTWKNVVDLKAGGSCDLVVTVSDIKALGSPQDDQRIVPVYQYKNQLYAAACGGASGQLYDTGVQSKWTVKVVNSSGATVSGTLLFCVKDLDAAGSDGTRTNVWAESIEPVSGFANDLYTVNPNGLSITSGRIHGDADRDTMDWYDGFVNLTSSPSSFKWAGYNAAGTAMFVNFLSSRITATAHDNGSITRPGTKIANWKWNYTYTATPNTGYYVSRLAVDGTNKSISGGGAKSHTFSQVTSDHTIESWYSPNP